MGELRPHLSQREVSNLKLRHQGIAAYVYLEIKRQIPKKTAIQVENGCLC